MKVFQVLVAIAILAGFIAFVDSDNRVVRNFCEVHKIIINVLEVTR